MSMTLGHILAQTSSTTPSMWSNLPPNGQYMLMAIAVLAIILIVFRPRFRKKKSDPLERPFGSGGLAQQRSVERQMQSLLVELSEMSRQITAQLDTRALKLELLIKEADEKIARLQTFGVDAEHARHARLTMPPTVTTSTGHPTANDALPATGTSSGNGSRSQDFGPHVTPADEPVVRREESNLETAPQLDARHVAIYALADGGKAPHDIARELDRPKGEIELILALRRRG